MENNITLDCVQRLTRLICSPCSLFTPD